jgi:hypothetical protein
MLALATWCSKLLTDPPPDLPRFSPCSPLFLDLGAQGHSVPW